MISSADTDERPSFSTSAILSKSMGASYARSHTSRPSTVNNHLAIRFLRHVRLKSLDSRQDRSAYCASGYSRGLGLRMSVQHATRGIHWSLLSRELIEHCHFGRRPATRAFSASFNLVGDAEAGSILNSPPYSISACSRADQASPLPRVVIEAAAHLDTGDDASESGTLHQRQRRPASR